MTPALPPPEVEVVIVTPPRLPALPGEAAFSAVRLGAADLAGTPRLDEALRQAPGVSLFRRTGSDAANPTIQGLSLRAIAPSGAGRALVTLDGAPQNDPFGGWVIWSALPAEVLGGARIVRGAGAGPYGAGALTGVVALEERTDVTGLGALDLSYGSRESWRGAVIVGAPGILLSASGSTGQGYVPVRAGRGGADTPTDLSDYSASVRLQRRIAGVETALRAGLYQERRGAGLLGAGSVASGAQASLTLGRTPDASGDGWRLQGWLRSSDLANTSVAVGAQRASTTPANDQYSTPAIGAGLNAAWRRRTSTLTLELGADARMAKGEVRERFRYQTGAFTRGRVAGGRTGVAGVYAEASHEAGELLLTGGARLDAWRNGGAFRKERDLAGGAVLLDQKPQGDSGVTPSARVGLRYGLGQNAFVRAAAYSGFRAPTLNELHRPFRVGNDVTEANPALKPEQLFGAEAGLGRDGALSWSLGAFYNELQDPITNVTIGLGPRTFPTAGFIPAGGVLRQRRNTGAIEAWGVEGEGAWRVSPSLQFRGAFAATRARVKGGAEAPQLEGLRPAQTPRLTLTAGVDWRPLEALSLEAAARYESARFEDDLNTRRLAPALKIDARAAWRVAPDAEVYLAAENLFDADLEVSETADGVEAFAAPRTLRVGFALRR